MGSRCDDNEWLTVGRIVKVGAIVAAVVEGGAHPDVRTRGARVSIGDLPPRFCSLIAVGQNLLIALRCGEAAVLTVGETVPLQIDLGCSDAARRNSEARAGLARMGLGDIPLSDGDALQTYAFIAEAANPEIEAVRVASIREGGRSKAPSDARAS